MKPLDGSTGLTARQKLSVIAGPLSAMGRNRCPRSPESAPNRPSVQEFVIYGGRTPKNLPGPVDYWTCIPLERMGGFEIRDAAGWKDPRFEAFTFEAGEHVILARIKGQEPREFVARSGLARRDELDKLKLAFESEIARLQGNPRQRAKII